jgi:hypothetical protein
MLIETAEVTNNLKYQVGFIIEIHNNITPKIMENKHTAVQWLVEKIQQANPSFKFDALIRQAKQMEKQEIINAYKQGQHDSEPIRPTDAEQYYNQTVKSE